MKYRMPIALTVLFGLFGCSSNDTELAALRQEVAALKQQLSDVQTQGDVTRAVATSNATALDTLKNRTQDLERVFAVAKQEEPQSHPKPQPKPQPKPAREVVAPKPDPEALILAEKKRRWLVLCDEEHETIHRIAKLIDSLSGEWGISGTDIRFCTTYPGNLYLEKRLVAWIERTWPKDYPKVLTINDRIRHRIDRSNSPLIVYRSLEKRDRPETISGIERARRVLSDRAVFELLKDKPVKLPPLLD